MKNFSKNILLATTAICAVAVFASSTRAEYTPTRGIENAAYTVTAVDSCTESASATGGCFRKVSGYDESGNPVYQAYEYTVRTDIEKVTTRANTVNQITSNNGKPYIGINGQGNYGAAIYVPQYTDDYTEPAIIDEIIGDFIANYSSVNYATSGLFGGAMGNSGTIKSLIGDFIGNYIDAWNAKKEARAGAIYNLATINEANSNFIKNKISTWNAESNGGAIYNTGTIGKLTGDFIANEARSSGGSTYGGAIYNKTGTIGELISNFERNSAATDYPSYGGAIYNGNTITKITGDFVGNFARGASRGGSFGGAIYNFGTITTISGDFRKNYANVDSDFRAYGGAIYNTNMIKNLTGDFTGNYAFSYHIQSYGGAIYNDGTIEKLTGDFIGNYSKSTYKETYGGAIYNTNKITMIANALDNAYEDDILFKGNYLLTTYTNAKTYEAIYNTGTLTFQSSGGGSYTFYDYINGSGNINFESVGENTGVLNLYNNIKGQANVNFIGDWNINMISPDDIHDGTSEYNSIKNMTVQSGSNISAAIDVNFEDYDAASEDGLTVDRFYIKGSNSGIITLDTINVIGTPTEEKVVQVIYDSTGGLQLALGEAYDGKEAVISSVVTDEIIDEVTTPLTWSDELRHRIITADYYGTYTLNEAKNSLTLSDIREDSSETVESLGDTLALLARSEAVTDDKEFNAVAGTTYYTLDDDIGAMKGTLTINGLEDVASTLDLNSHTGFVLGDDAVALNFNDLTVGGNTTIANVTNSSATIGMDHVTLNGAITGNAASISATDSIINANLAATLINLTRSTMRGSINEGAAVNMDGATIDMVDGTIGNMILSSLNVTGASTINVEASLSGKIMDNIKADSVTISSGTLNIVITLLDDTSDKITYIPFINDGEATGLENVSTKASISNQNSYYVQYDAENRQFVFTNQSRGGGTKPRRSAATNSSSATSATTAVTGAVTGQTMSHGGTMVVNGANSGDEPLGLSTWVKAFGSNDDIELKHLTQKVDTQFYGLVGGIDSKNFAYENGVHAVYGVYGAYVQGRQKLEDTKITNKSGYLGLSAALRKEAVFSNFSLTGGFIANEASTEWGKDKFDTKVVSVANQTGVDIRKDEWTITPALTLSYTGVDTDDYTSKAGTKIKNKFMNVFNVAPEVKVAKDFGEGLNGYAKAAYKMFFFDHNKIEADDVLMPAMSVKPYVEYGVGLTKDWSKEEWNPKDMTTFAEINRHDGGREGWDINLGLKLDF